MRLQYVQAKLDAAVSALSAGDGDPRRRLYAAYLQLHTLLPEHVPDGPSRERLRLIHDQFTRHDAAAPHEDAVTAVLGGLDDRAIADLAEQIRALRDQLNAARAPAPAAAVGDATRRPRAATVASAARILLVFGTTDRHTQKLAQFVSARLEAAGRRVRLLHADKANVECSLAEFDAALLAASLHYGRYQNGLVDFAARYHAALNAMPTAFISVSISAAGAHPGAASDLKRDLSGFLEETQWRPQAVHHAAGAIRHAPHDYFRDLSTIMLMERRGEPARPVADYDMTDYERLAAFATGFVQAPADVARPAPR